MVVEIADWNDLDAVRNDLSADYVLVNNLDSETDGYAGIGDDFTPIGNGNNEFVGTFDGGGYGIADMSVDNDDRPGGLFSTTESGALIENVFVSGSVTDPSDGFDENGGLVGNHQGGIIKNCAVNVDVSAVDTERAAGGLCGAMSDGTVEKCYALGSVDGNERVGGLVGNNSDGLVDTCYSVGAVSGNDDVGGLVGSTSSFDVEDSYWDVQSSGQTTSDDGTGLDTVEMQGEAAKTNMDGFDFANMWDSVVNGESTSDNLLPNEDGYPILVAVDDENQLESQNTGFDTVADLDFAVWRSLVDGTELKTF